MGYYTSYHLEWEDKSGDPVEVVFPRCKHKNPPNAKYCTECGVPTLPVCLDDKIGQYIEDNEHIFHAIDKLGKTVESCKWYEHKKDMRQMSLEFRDILFKLHGEGEESGDIWDKYFLNGKMQECKAKIVIEPFDERKLK